MYASAECTSCGQKISIFYPGKGNAGRLPKATPTACAYVDTFTGVKKVSTGERLARTAVHVCGQPDFLVTNEEQSDISGYELFVSDQALD